MNRQVNDVPALIAICVSTSSRVGRLLTWQTFCWADEIVPSLAECLSNNEFKHMCDNVVADKALEKRHSKLFVHPESRSRVLDQRDPSISHAHVLHHDRALRNVDFRGFIVQYWCISCQTGERLPATGALDRGIRSILILGLFLLLLIVVIVRSLVLILVLALVIVLDETPVP